MDDVDRLSLSFRTPASSSRIVLGTFFRLLFSCGLSCVGCLFGVTFASAEEVWVRGGGRLEGEVVRQGKEVLIDSRFGKVSIPQKFVVKIEKGPTQQMEERRAQSDLQDPDSRMAFALWCRSQGRRSRAVREVVEVLASDPDNTAAHLFLGHQKADRDWSTRAAIMESEGYVSRRGRWKKRPDEDSAELRARDKRREEEWSSKTVNRWLREIAYGTEGKSGEAVEALASFAKDRGDTSLLALAYEVQETYDQFWGFQRVRRLAQVEIRGSVSKLRRPIRSMSSPLGGTSSPVTIQLPELGVTSIRTTVSIPAGRGK